MILLKFKELSITQKLNVFLLVLSALFIPFYFQTIVTFVYSFAVNKTFIECINIVYDFPIFFIAGCGLSIISLYFDVVDVINYYSEYTSQDNVSDWNVCFWVYGVAFAILLFFFYLPLNWIYKNILYLLLKSIKTLYAEMKAKKLAKRNKHIQYLKVLNTPINIELSNIKQTLEITNVIKN